MSNVQSKVTCSLASWVILATILLYGSTILLLILERHACNNCKSEGAFLKISEVLKSLIGYDGENTFSVFFA